jgi:hypothetical protein
MNSHAVRPLSCGRAHSAKNDAADVLAGQITARTPAVMHGERAIMRASSGDPYLVVLCCRLATDSLILASFRPFVSAAGGVAGGEKRWRTANVGPGGEGTVDVGPRGGIAGVGP